MSVTAVDLSVVTIESLVAQDISAFSLRRREGSGVGTLGAQASTRPSPASLRKNRSDTSVPPGRAAARPQ